MSWHFPFNLAAIIGWCIGISLAYFLILRPAAQQARRRAMSVRDEDREAQLEAPEGIANDVLEEADSIKLLITGYGPFRGYPTENPSTLTARHLDGLVLDVPPSASPDEAPKRRRRRVEVTFRSLAVTYEEVDSIIPPLHEQGIYDAFIHVGVASRARDGLRLEQRGRKGMYNSVDSESQHCQPDNEGKRTVPDWKAQEDEMWSTLDLPALLAWLRDDMGIEHVRLSTDAGLYLCEYVYATSLNAACLAVERRGSSARSAPCLFVHVPDLRPAGVSPSDDLPVYTEREVTRVLRDICIWVGAHV